MSILTKYGISEEEYQELLTICPNLEIIDAARAIKNISLLEQFGFPSSDIDSLILTNPDFLLNDPKWLAETLLKLNGDVEVKIKENPFLI